MKTRSIFLSAVLLMSAMCFTSCTDFAKKMAMKAVSESAEFEKEDTVKWGPIVEQDVELPPFTAIDAKGAVRIVFTQDSVCSVRVRGNEKCISGYEFVVRNDELKVVPKDFNGSVRKSTPAVTLFIAAPNLSDIEFSGAGQLDMPEAVSLPGSLEVEMAGAGDIRINDLTLTSLNVEISGAGKCDLDKVTASDDIEIEVNGAGEVNANVFCQDLSVELNGAGEAVLSGECKGTFTCNQAGASKIDTSNLKR